MTADLATVLDDATLAALRAQYSADFMLAASRGAVVGPHPAAAGYVNWVVDYLYDGTRLKPADRERCLVALLAAKTTDASFTLAVHLYWAMMEGLTVDELADVLALAGTYHGMPHYAMGQVTFRKTLDALRGLYARTPTTCDPAAVIGALRSAFA